jgi:hypothetical protein
MVCLEYLLVSVLCTAAASMHYLIQTGGTGPGAASRHYLIQTAGTGPGADYDTNINDVMKFTDQFMKINENLLKFKQLRFNDDGSVRAAGVGGPEGDGFMEIDAINEQYKNLIKNMRQLNEHKKVPAPLADTTDEDWGDWGTATGDDYMFSDAERLDPKLVKLMGYNKKMIELLRTQGKEAPAPGSEFHKKFTNLLNTMKGIAKDHDEEMKLKDKSYKCHAFLKSCQGEKYNV